jgi:aconitate hydratase
MAFDIEMIKKVYQKYPEAIQAARKACGKPLTLSEKILYAHLWDGNATQEFKRGKDYVRRYCSNGSFAIYASWKK